MLMRQKDSHMGFVKETITLFKNGMDESGKIYVCDEGIVLKQEGDVIKAPFDYVRMLEKVGELPLGKVAVEAQIYDQMGNKYDLALNMADNHFDLLKKMCPKA